MKRLFAVIMAVFAIFSFSTPQQAMAKEPTNTEQPIVLYSSYYSGTIGNNMGITLYLERHSTGEYFGWYYYNKYGPKNKLALIGREDADGTIKLLEFNDNGQLSAGFEGIFNNYGEFIGIMYVVHSGKRYSCKLIPIR